MKKFDQLLIVLAVAVNVPPTFAAADTWTIDPAHSSARFSVKHMMVSNVTGQFSKLSGTVDYDGKDLKNAKVDTTIDVNSITTSDEHRDAHLKSKDFFDASAYPTMTFKSKKIQTEANGCFKIVGDLTLHGVTKEVALDAEPLAKPIKDPKGKTRTGTSASVKINRKDFGIAFDKNMDNGGAMVGDDVKITLDVELVKTEG